MAPLPGPTRTYPSKRDAWLVIALWIAVLSMLAAAVAVWRDPDSGTGLALGMVILMIGAGAFVIWILYGTQYILADHQLVICSGPFRWRVSLDAIQEIFPTHNPLSSPACSLDRLKIRYDGSRMGVMISPEEKAAFLRDIAARSPGLRIDGDRVVREQG